MADIGNFALILGLVLAAFTGIIAVVGARTGRGELILTAENGALATVSMVTLAVGSLVYLLVTGDLTINYVAGHINKDLPMFYKVSSLWAGQEGSLLFWNWVLSVYIFIFVLLYRKKSNPLTPYVIFILMATTFFFFCLHLFVANPFDRLVVAFADGTMNPWSPQDGKGLNPLLQHPAMVFHPPMLYTGYIGFAIPFAFAIAALATNRLGAEWIRLSRRWTIIAWFFLGTGIILGGKWAYVELGWGGYWAWDPVENASLMPWLIGTAFLHSVMVQEKRGMLKIWNISMIIGTYILCILGTFLTRSGVVSSVHAFAQSNIGVYFLTFIGFLLIVSLGLLYLRLDDLKSENSFDVFSSRESSFLFNNLLLLGSCLAVLWGTTFPIISEWVTGEKITVGQPFFNKINVPIGLALLILTGVGPVLAWRKTSTESLKRNFLLPVLLGLIAVGISFGMGTRHVYALISIGSCVFVFVTIVQEFLKGAIARASSTGENILKAVVNLTRKNKRRYGGYIVHFGIVLIFVGFTGKAFESEAHIELGEGEEFTVKNYTLKLTKLEQGQTPNYFFDKAFLSVWKDGKNIENVVPERRQYIASEQPTTEVEIHETLLEDIYLVFNSRNEDESKAEIQIYINPLVSFVWVGALVMVLGTFVAMFPDLGEEKFKQRAREKAEKLILERV
ncbi:heme lyase CcmF/NrfE family subunit [bacterium]|nr:heme lyase CcmF/NrfE family subunit [bacterium]